MTESESRVHNLDLLCRICANPDTQLMSIFDGAGVEHNLFTKINTYLPIKVTKDDRLPSNVCYNCASTIIGWHTLYENSKVANVSLQKLFRGEICDEDYQESAHYEAFDCDVDINDDSGCTESSHQSYLPDIIHLSPSTPIQQNNNVIVPEVIVPKNVLHQDGNDAAEINIHAAEVNMLGGTEAIELQNLKEEHSANGLEVSEKSVPTTIDAAAPMIKRKPSSSIKIEKCCKRIENHQTKRQSGPAAATAAIGQQLQENNTGGEKSIADKTFEIVSTCCSRNCHFRISKSDQSRLFTEFYDKVTREAQDIFLSNCMSLFVPKVPRSPAANPSKLQRWNYYLPIRAEVCRSFVLKLFKITERRSRTIQGRMLKGYTFEEMRGSNRQNTISHHIWDLALRHLESIPHKSSDLPNETNRSYFLDPNLTNMNIYNSFVEFYKNETNSELNLKYKTWYRFLKRTKFSVLSKPTKPKKEKPATTTTTSTISLPLNINQDKNHTDLSQEVTNNFQWRMQDWNRKKETLMLPTYQDRNIVTPIPPNPGTTYQWRTTEWNWPQTLPERQ